MNIYKEVGSAVSEAQAIAEAFAAILRVDFPTARRHLAAAQVDHYGQKPWARGVPTMDALDRKIVFSDTDGMRYTVPIVFDATGCHVRHLMFGPTYTGRFDQFEVRAPNESQAHSIARTYLASINEEEHRMVQSMELPGGWVAVRYAFGRMALD